MDYYSYIIRSILGVNEFGITAVNDLRSLKTIYFVQEEYEEIEKLIKSENIDLIKSFREDQPDTRQYLDILSFEDQNKKKYIVTTFDSDALEQDPQAIAIYPIS